MATAPAVQNGTPKDNPVATLRTLLDRSRSQLAMALPKHLTADRMIRVAVTAVQRTPSLLECSPLSIVGCVMQAGELGLELSGPLGQAYMVPRWNSKARCKEACFQIGYRGLVALAFRSDRVSFFNAHDVREKDAFDFEYGTRQRLIHKPALGDRGNPIAYYSVFRLKDGAADFEVMSLAEIEAHRDRFSQKPKFGEWVWETSFDEMAKKTPLRRLAKRAPISIELTQAASLDEYGEAGVNQDLARSLGIQHEDAGPPLGRQSVRRPQQPLDEVSPPTPEHDERAEAEAAQAAAELPGREPGSDDPE